MLFDIPGTFMEMGNSNCRSKLKVCEQDHDAPPSSQPRPDSSSSEDKEDEDEEEQEDNTLLINNTLLSTITNSPRTAHDLLQIKTSVQDFAVEHPFWAKSTLDEEEVLEFENDVFEFAKAAGLGDNLAKLEVMRAMGAWKASKGLPIAQAGHIEQIFDKVLGTIEVVKEAIGSGQKKRKREEKVAVAPTPVLLQTIESSKDVEAKEPKAKRQRRREKKRKLDEDTVPAAQITAPVPATSDAVDHTKSEQADSKTQKRQEKKKRKLEEEGSAPVEATSPNPVTTNQVEAVKEGERPVDQKRQKSREAEKKKIDQPAVPTAVHLSKSELKSAKRIKNEKKKEKKKRAKQGPVTSSYFSKTDISVSAKAEKALPEIDEKPVPTQVETDDVPMEDVSDDKPFSVDKNGVDNEVLGQSNTADKEEKKKRKKKRNKNRLAEDEATDSSKAAEERAARKQGRSTKVKDEASQIAESAATDVVGRAEKPAKKKRVRSRVMKGDQNATDKANILEANTESRPESKDKSKGVTASPIVAKPSSDDTQASNKSTEEELIVRPVRTFDANGVFGATNDKNLDMPDVAIERVAIEPAAPKEKSRKRRKKSETEVEVEAEVTTTDAPAPTESEPPKKKSRDRKRKSINKLLDAQVTGAEETTIEPLLELPDTNSEKKKHKRDKSRKRSSIGTEVEAQTTKEASNSSHS